MPGPSAIQELDFNLCEQGLQINAVSAASAFLALARHKRWVQAAPAVGVAWLADLACEVLKPGLPIAPLLDELGERLDNNSVNADSRKVAAAILGIALEEGWHDEPARMIVWLERLAVDVVQLSPGRSKISD